MSSPTIPSGKVPEGWTTDPMLLESHLMGEGAIIARRCCLKNPVTIMCTSPESGECYSLIADEGRYYLSNNMELFILEIQQPKTLDEILRMIRDDRQKAPITEYLEQVITQEERQQEEEKRKENIAKEASMMAQPGCLNWKAHPQDKLRT